MVFRKIPNVFFFLFFSTLHRNRVRRGAFRRPPPPPTARRVRRRAPARRGLGLSLYPSACDLRSQSPVLNTLPLTSEPFHLTSNLSLTSEF